jgi:hypothetical protein
MMAAGAEVKTPLQAGQEMMNQAGEAGDQKTQHHQGSQARAVEDLASPARDQAASPARDQVAAGPVMDTSATQETK